MLFTCWCYYRNNAQAKKDFIPVNVVLAVSFQVQYRVHFLHYSDLVAESGWWQSNPLPKNLLKSIVPRWLSGTITL